MYDVIVVGGASAGLTSAMYTSRQGLKTVVITKDREDKHYLQMT